MIKLLENGTLAVVKIYNTIYSARMDLRQRDKENCLVEYDNKIYSINKFLELINNN